MPAAQRGQIYRTSTGYGIRWYDESGKRRRRSGFKSRSEARQWYEDVERRRMRGDIARPAQMTFAELVERYLRAHGVGREGSTMTTLRQRLSHSVVAFGELKLSELERMTVEIAEWRTTLPERSRYGIVQALRQTLEAGVRWGLMARNPAKLAGSNPQPRQPEIEPFTRIEVDRLAIELGPWGAVALFAGETGLRPSEWIALEWRDVSRADGVTVVQRTFSRGRLKSYGKTERSRRRVPLSTRAVDALDSSRIGSTPDSSSLLPAAGTEFAPDTAATSTSTTGERANGSPPSTLPACRGDASTTSATRSPPGRSPPGCPSSNSRATWGRRST